MSLPTTRLIGDPYSQGLEHGRALRLAILHNLDVYARRFAVEARLPWHDVLRRAARYGQAVEEQSPDYATAMRGIADGAGVDRVAIAALNVRYELMYDRLGRLALADGCTAFALAPGASVGGHLLLGQNWDWIPEVRCAILHTVDPDGFETLSVTEAGIVGGKIGLNAAGLGLAINGLTTTDDDWSRLARPFHVRCFEILHARDVATALRIVTGETRSCSTNFLIAQAPDRIVDVEAAPERARVVACETGCLVHANHFVDPEQLGITETPSELGPDTYRRQSRLHQLLTRGPPCSVEDVQRYLRDHDGFPSSICRHEDPADPPDERYATVVSVVADLAEQTLWVSDGQPCAHPYERVSLSDRRRTLPSG
jgi:isopenicillin-N N-acyltransferase-like protein